MLDVDPAMSGRVESWGPTAHLQWLCALVLLHRAGDASPAGVAAYSTIEREGGVSCMP